ncbi:MAG: hypothetical protein N2314_08260 [Brevinematales bacterium]|nr:hypothetical protein [Brevinematales bacterium]
MRTLPLFLLGGYFFFLSGCSLLLGPISDLSVKTRLSSYTSEWIGEWPHHMSRITFRNIQISQMAEETSPSFFICYYTNTFASSVYDHISQKRLSPWLNNGVACSEPFEILLSPDQKEAVVYGKDASGNIYLTNLHNTSSSILPFSSGTMMALATTGKKTIVVTRETPFHRLYSIDQNTYSQRFGSFEVPESDTIHLGSLVAKEETSSLILVTTNMTNFVFLTSTGDLAPFPPITIPTASPFYHGVVRNGHIYLLLPMSSSIELWVYFGTWEKKAVFPSTGDIFIQRSDILLDNDIIYVAIVEKDTSLRLIAYRDTEQKAIKIEEIFYTLPPDRGTIDGIDFFLDKVRDRILLGILHSMGNDHHVGISYLLW